MIAVHLARRPEAASPASASSGTSRTPPGTVAVCKTLASLSTCPYIDRGTPRAPTARAAMVTWPGLTTRRRTPWPSNSPEATTCGWGSRTRPSRAAGRGPTAHLSATSRPQARASCATTGEATRIAAAFGLAAPEHHRASGMTWAALKAVGRLTDTFAGSTHRRRRRLRLRPCRPCRRRRHLHRRHRHLRCRHLCRLHLRRRPRRPVCRRHRLQRPRRHLRAPPTSRR